jgi:hypothetical protein
MPIHDWTRVDAGLFHAFHQAWIVHLCDALNAGGLQPEYFALTEQLIRGPIPDVLTLRLSADDDAPDAPIPGLAVAAAPLEASYQASWTSFSAPMKRLLECSARNPREDL